MSQRKAERMMNLVIALLVTRQFLSKEQIRESVAGYQSEGGDETAFDRMFERDKKELRDLGIEVETGSNSAFFDDDTGYRIRRDTFELADIEFSAEEAAVVGLAARVWQHAGLAGESANALVKLKAAGIDVDTNELFVVEPQLSADEAAFDPLWRACAERIPVSFGYRRPGADLQNRRVQTRHVQPWQVLSWRGRWYLVCFDLDRQSERLFRLSRVDGEVTFCGEPGSYSIPQGADIHQIAEALFPAPPTGAAVVRVRRGRCQDLRRKAQSVRPVDTAMTPVDTEGLWAEGNYVEGQWDEITVKYASVWELAAEICSFGPDAFCVSPADLRDDVVARLQSAVAPGPSV